MASTALACADCPVRDKAVCAALAPDEKIKLAEIGRTQNFAAGEAIFEAHDDRMACATLIDGVAKLSTIDEHGNERIVALLHPAGFLGRLFATHRDFYATALTDCKACLFPRAKFEQVMADNPELTNRILQRTLESLEESRKLIDMIGKRRAVARVASFLLMVEHSMCETPEVSGTVFALPLTRGEIADLLGLTIETVSRQIGVLEKDGLILRIGTRHIRIVDSERLRSVATG